MLRSGKSGPLPLKFLNDAMDFFLAQLAHEIQRPFFKPQSNLAAEI